MTDQLSADLASLKIDRSGPPRRSRGMVALLLVATLGTVGWAAQRYARPYLEAQVWKTEVAVTEIGSISPAQAAVDLTATGYVVPQVTARVGAKVIARIEKTGLREGQAVKKNELLFELDGSTEEGAIAATRARSFASGARVATVKAQRAELELEVKRQRRLLESGAVAKSVVDDLDARIASLDAQIKAAEAETYAANAEVDSQKTVLKSLKIFSPIDGVIVSKPAAIGDVTQPGIPLAEIVDMSSLLVEADVSEGRLSLVKPGGPCEIALDALPEERFAGVVVEIGPRLNRAKATAMVKVRFDKPPVALRPEMSARVSFRQKPLDEAALREAPKKVVPASAVIERAGAKAVYVIEGGKVKLVPVVLGETTAGGFVVLEGPAPGTRVVKDPPATLSDGMAVKEKSAS